MKSHTKQLQNGFVLATMIVLSTVMLIVGATLLQTIVSVLRTYSESYYTSVATQAAEAGVVMANTCVTNNSYQQTWSTSAPLTQKMSCTGAADGSARDYVLKDTQVRSSFSVDNLTARIDGALIIKSTGTVDIMRGTTVIRSKSVVVNQMVTWPVNYSGGTNSSGWTRTCGIVSKSAYCWGTNEVGQLGDGTTNNSTVPVKVRQDAFAGQTVTTIRSGHSHNCIIASKKVYCWGFNNYGQLGNNSTTSSSIPVAVNSAWGAQDVTDIATSSMSSCAIAGGDVYCWGRNNSGQLGINSGAAQVLVPTKITGLPSTATKLMSSGAGMETMCAIVGGGVYCWGKNAVGQVGDGTLTDRPAPVAVTTNLSGKTVTDISGDAAWSGNVGVVGSTSGGHVCAVASNQAYCWGNNRVNSSSASGEVGIGSTGPYFSTPRAVTTTSMSAPVTEIITGSYHSCAISGGEVFCWGRNNYGQLGNRTYGSVGSSNVPVKVAQDEGVFLNKTVSQLGGGFNRGCGVVDQKTYCWGNNDLGQIGDGTSGNVRDYPTESIFLRPRAPIFLF